MLFQAFPHVLKLQSRVQAATIGFSCPPFPGGAVGRVALIRDATLCPFDYRCVDKSLLNGMELNWLNRYHTIVREQLHELVSGDAEEWLFEFMDFIG
ncbi:M24 family metallopeptidase C-terminal domain-containing protein [Burkholderia sp. R-69980]|nr:M24 family metallopeptidase C-terminal domain-containing protein [Burkholderia sp. R-69980]